jgi:hypothetical protein
MDSSPKQKTYHNTNALCSCPHYDMAENCVLDYLESGIGKTSSLPEKLKRTYICRT